MKEKKGKKIVLDGRSLSIKAFVHAARNSGPAIVSLRGIKKSKRGRHFLDHSLRTGKTIYGTNTGFGSNVRFTIPLKDLARHQKKLVYSLAAGSAPFLNDEISRGFMVARLNCFAKGYSGVRPEIIHVIERLLAKDMLPFVPRYGSLGASGDLVLSSGLALALMGEGKVRHNGKAISAKSALRMIGASSLEFMPKEALAVVNNTSVMTTVAAFVVSDMEYLLTVFTKAAAMYTEVLGGITDPFDELLHELKNHPGATEAARELRKQVKGSKLAQSTENIHGEVQDPYSIRCLPQFLGPHRELLSLLRLWVTRELNSANDNPLIDGDGKKILHGGNFSGFYIGLGMDFAKILLAHLANMEQTMIDRLLDSDKNHILPPSLAGIDPGLNSGLKGVGISAGSYFAESVQRSFPHSVLSRPFESGNQDIVSFGTLAAEAAYDLVDLNRALLARLVMVVCAAADLRGWQKLSPEGKKFYKKIRSIAHPRREDSVGIDLDLAHIAELIKRRSL
ncbi:aromatic amino acid lyase [Patescibacteria group bacterium]|nr:aromatic amino acid lyase [Patescibacteria group bacterium]